MISKKTKDFVDKIFTERGYYDQFNVSKSEVIVDFTNAMGDKKETSENIKNTLFEIVKMYLEGGKPILDVVSSDVLFCPECVKLHDGFKSEDGSMERFGDPQLVVEVFGIDVELKVPDGNGKIKLLRGIEAQQEMLRQHLAIFHPGNSDNIFKVGNAVSKTKTIIDCGIDFDCLIDNKSVVEV